MSTLPCFPCLEVHTLSLPLTEKARVPPSRSPHPEHASPPLPHHKWVSPPLPTLQTVPIRMWIPACNPSQHQELRLSLWCRSTICSCVSMLECIIISGRQGIYTMHEKHFTNNSKRRTHVPDIFMCSAPLQKRSHILWTSAANTQPRQLNKIQKPACDPRLLLYLYMWIELTEHWIRTEIWDLNKYLSLRTWEIILTNLELDNCKIEV